MPCSLPSAVRPGHPFTAGQAVFRSTASRADTPITIDLTNGEVGPIDATLNVLDR